MKIYRTLPCLANERDFFNIPGEGNSYPACTLFASTTHSKRNPAIVAYRMHFTAFTVGRARCYVITILLKARQKGCERGFIVTMHYG